MKFPRRKFLHLTAGAAVLPAVSRVARAQAYPSRPVRLIVGSPPGGVVDLYARLIGQWLSERLGQPFIIENRAGAGGNIGTEAVVRAAPDGYTLLQITSGHSWNVTLYDKLNFNFIRDIAPVASIYSSACRLVGKSVIPGKVRSRADRLCQGQSRQDQHGVDRCRDCRTCLRRAVQDEGWGRYAPHTVSRLAASRSSRRAGATYVRTDWFVARIYSVR